MYRQYGVTVLTEYSVSVISKSPGLQLPAVSERGSPTRCGLLCRMTPACMTRPDTILEIKAFESWEYLPS